MMKRRTFLVEIGTEELPPGSLKRLARAFLDEVSSGLAAASLGFHEQDVQWFATPRRLAVLVRDLEPRQPDSAGTRTGPSVDVAFDADGKPTRAAEGFAKSVGATVEDLKEVATDKGRKLAFEFKEKGKSAAELVPGIIARALDRLPISRRMRWGAGRESFVRPVHWLVTMLDGELVDMSLFGVRSGRQTRGHRFHDPDPLPLDDAADYQSALESAHVIAGFGARRKRIRGQVQVLAEQAGGVAAADDSLLDEVAALTEWPVAIAGEFDDGFLELPPEVIATTLVHHEKSFPVFDGEGRPMARFIAVANIESRNPEAVRQGYQRVVRPRLADAAFFFRQDCKSRLDGRLDDLDGMLFHERLGSLRDKSLRIEALCRTIAAELGVDPDAAARAGRLCKCDLTTLMVGEFPELQGVMGCYYAENDGESEAVSAAIGGHYRPRFAGDETPADTAGQVVALADKLDTVCGILLAGERPSGNKDPFALRRAALGALRILIERELPLDLAALVGWSCTRTAEERELDDTDEARREILDFFFDRLKAWYRDQGVGVEVFESVRATNSTRPLDFHNRVQAVNVFLKLPEAASLAAANKRIRNILRQAGEDFPDDTDPGLLAEDQERALLESVTDKRGKVEPLIESGDYQGALEELAGLKAPVDAFFDHVMVMAEDDALRRNRLALLSGVNRMFSRIADVSRLDVGGSD